MRRTRELDKLDDYLTEALAGNGRIAFITGGASGMGRDTVLRFLPPLVITEDDIDQALAIVEEVLCS